MNKKVMNVRKKLILTLAMLIVLGCFSTAYAAEDDNVITLEQAKGLVSTTSRSLKKYEIKIDKAKYQMYQAEDQSDDTLDRYNSMSSKYNNLWQEYASLQDKLNDGDSSVVARMNEIEVEMRDLEGDMDTQYEKIDSSSDNSRDAENNHDDSIKKEENYRKQLAYIVEEIYTNILNEEESLLALNKEYELKQYLLTVERKKLELGRSTQLKVDQLLQDITNLNKKIIELTNLIKTKKGQLNDMMGKDYADELKLTPFEVKTSVEIPEYDQLLSSATQAYDTLWELKRDINDMEDDQDDEDDYYTSLLLGLDIEEKELQLEDEKLKLNEVINNLITALKTKQEEYQLSLTDFRNAQKSFEWDKKRFELGQISKLALMESELNYLNMQDKKTSTGYDLYLAQRSLELAEDGIFL